MAFENSRQTLNSTAVCTFWHPTFCLWKTGAVKLLVLPRKMSPIPYLIKIIFVCNSQDLKWSADSWTDLERSLPFLTWKQECAKGARGDKRSYFVCKRRSCPNFFARKRQLLVLIRNAQTIAVVGLHPKTQSLGDAESIVGLSDRVTAVQAPVYQVTIQTCPPIWWGIALPHRCP